MDLVSGALRQQTRLVRRRHGGGMLVAVVGRRRHGGGIMLGRRRWEGSLKLLPGSQRKV